MHDPASRQPRRLVRSLIVRSPLRTLLPLALIAAALAAVGAVALPLAASQHGHSTSSLEDHFAEMVRRLELTEEQRAAIDPPLREAMALIEDLHRLHDQIVAELTEEQRATLRDMLHEHVSSGALLHDHQDRHEQDFHGHDRPGHGPHDQNHR